MTPRILSRYAQCFSPIDADEVEAHTVQKGTNNLGLNVTDADVLNEYLYPELADL